MPAASANRPPASTAIAFVDMHGVSVHGKNLSRELIGRIGFTEYFLFLLTGRLPGTNLVAATNACLVAIAEHGLVPSVQAARMTLAAAPDALQGAVAAGILGCGSVILGASETAGLMLREVLDGRGEGTLADSADAVVSALRSARKPLPGFGHPTHKEGDPRAHRLLEIARELGLAGKHVAALEAVAAAVPKHFSRALPLNVSGAIPAVLLDAGYPAGALKGVPLLARVASLIAHLQEESQQPIGFALADAAEHAIAYSGPEARTA
ncbi:citryl-CoA lyase [Cupriavidus necator]|uniref:citryl-CoA lyase n=1 Tax=Cupriavidus necator TaxID=106590 RepID=UPI00148F4B17|nr:citryl-CoA lyase [Cupriavidus necator]NOV23969.1 citryl-CoA lyase [Cupriavidus necator]